MQEHMAECWFHSPTPRGSFQNLSRSLSLSLTPTLSLSLCWPGEGLATTECLVQDFLSNNETESHKPTLRGNHGHRSTLVRLQADTYDSRQRSRAAFNICFISIQK